MCILNLLIGCGVTIIITEVYMISFIIVSGGYSILCTTLSSALFTRNLKTRRDEIQQVLHNVMYSLSVKLIIEMVVAVNKSGQNNYYE